MAGLSARAFNRDLQTFDAGDQLAIRLDPTGSLVKSASGVAVSPSVFSGLSWKDNARAASNANVTLSGTQTIDGIALAADERVLLTAQTTASENGIWEVKAGAWARPLDFPNAGDATSAIVAVDEGTTFADTIWRQTGDSIVIDTGAQVWSQLPFGTSATAGAGIGVSGTAVSLDLGNGIAALGAAPAIGDSLVFSDASDSGNEKLATVEQLGQGVIEGATALGANVAIDDQLVITDTSGANALRQVTTSQIVSGVIAGATALTAVAEDDVFVLSDTSDSGNAKNITAANLRKELANIIESVTLTAAQVTARSVTLTNAVTSATKSFLTSRGGAQNYSGDGELTITAGAAGAATATWATGTAGDGSMGGEFTAGDVLRFHLV